MPANDDHNPGTFLVNNYKQALNILANAPPTLENAKKELGVTDNSVFEKWLLEEREYLQGLKLEPQEEVLEMEYCQRLFALQACEYVVQNFVGCS